MATTTNCIQTSVPTSDLSLCLSAYQYALGYPASRSVQIQLIKLLEMKCASLICAVLEYTAATAPRPSWPYARAVINKQLAMGNKSAEEFNAACERYRAEHAAQVPTAAYAPRFYQAGPKKVSAQMYEQREYKPEEVNDMSEEDILAAMAM